MTRWRAPYGEKYYTILGEFSVDYDFDYYCSEDDYLYESGNYFETEAEAEEVAAKFRAVLKEHHNQKGGQQ